MIKLIAVFLLPFAVYDYVIKEIYRKKDRLYRDAAKGVIFWHFLLSIAVVLIWIFFKNDHGNARFFAVRVLGFVVWMIYLLHSIRLMMFYAKEIYDKENIDDDDEVDWISDKDKGTYAEEIIFLKDDVKYVVGADHIVREYEE